jgi:hypothetical protein
MDKFKAMETFVRIVEAGSLSGAAGAWAPRWRRWCAAWRPWSAAWACACSTAPRAALR